MTHVRAERLLHPAASEPGEGAFVGLSCPRRRPVEEAGVGPPREEEEEPHAGLRGDAPRGEGAVGFGVGGQGGRGW